MVFFSISVATPYTVHSQISTQLLRCTIHTLKCKIEGIIHVGQVIWGFKLLDYFLVEIFALNYLKICLGSLVHFISITIGED